MLVHTHTLVNRLTHESSAAPLGPSLQMKPGLRQGSPWRRWAGAAALPPAWAQLSSTRDSGHSAQRLRTGASERRSQGPGEVGVLRVQAQLVASVPWAFS